ncbi:hypothetical protein GCK32_011297 [Trichostrongylus colubriformis]|uniref:Protection of telomeres protein 1 n=1 Tax=Trichostrongylus colubriformis TaxID=6319 RepID=A0AAN8FTU7_TRICO
MVFNLRFDEIGEDSEQSSRSLTIRECEPFVIELPENINDREVERRIIEKTGVEEVALRRLNCRQEGRVAVSARGTLRSLRMLRELSSIMAKPPLNHYQYTNLQHIPDSGRVNVYGVVRSITALTFGGQIIQIEDEDGAICVRVKKESDAFFKRLQVNDILRLHRVEIGSYCNEKTLIVEIGVYGCHAVAWSSSSNTPTIITSRKFTFDDHDATRLSELRQWSGNEDNTEEMEGSPSTSQSSEPQMDDSPSTETSAVMEDSPSHQLSAVSVTKENATTMKHPEQSKCVVVQSTSHVATRMLSKPCITVESASEIPDLWSKFFNWYAEVLGVYKGKGEPFTVFVKVWDGTLPSFPESRNMFRADSNSIEITYCEGPSSVLAAIDDYTIDVCCYGEWARKAMVLKVGDVVFFSNMRNYMCKSKNSSALTMHEDGTNFGRALTVVDESDPVHFDISKRCADTLAEYLVSESGLIDSASGLNVTPIRADDVVAQSTPMVSKRTEEPCPIEAISSRKETGGLAIVDVDDGGLEIVAEEAVGLVCLVKEIGWRYCCCCWQGSLSPCCCYRKLRHNWSFLGWVTMWRRGSRLGFHSAQQIPSALKCTNG